MAPLTHITCTHSLQRENGIFLVQRFQTYLLIKASEIGSWMNDSFFCFDSPSKQTIKRNKQSTYNSVYFLNFVYFGSFGNGSPLLLFFLLLFKFFYFNGRLFTKNSFRLLLNRCKTRFVETDRQTTDSPISMHASNKLKKVQFTWIAMTIISNRNCNIKHEQQFINNKQMSIVSWIK